MGQVVNFGSDTNYTKPNDILVQVLEDLLEQAKEGDLRSIAFIGLTSTNTVVTGKVIEDGANIFEVVGALNYLSERVIREYIE